MTNPGFEIWEDTSSSYYPNTYGDWTGDISNIINGVQNGINPFEGSQMLKFIHSYTHTSYIPEQTACDVFQLIDISGYQSLISTGQAVASLSGYFNRVSGDSQTDSRFRMSVVAYEGNVSDFSSIVQNPPLARGRISFYSDGDINSWELLSAEVVIPVETDFLAISMGALEDVFNDTSGTEFDGHYADAISLTIIPEPCTFILLGIGCVMLRKGR